MIKVSENENHVLWKWHDWLIACEKNHNEKVRDFFFRVLYGRTNEKNANLRPFGNVDEGVFHISEIEAANEFLNSRMEKSK